MTETVQRLTGGSARALSPSRRGGCCGVAVLLAGLGLMVAAAPLLAWNEGRAVSTYRTLIEGAAIVRNIRTDAVDPANDGKLVHLAGMATTSEILRDPDLGVSAPAIKLRRKAEMYQWHETEHTSSNSNDNSSDTTYTYNAVWSETWINSRQFHETSGHNNPDSMPYTSATWTAQTVSLGAFTLSASLVKQIKTFEPLVVSQIPRTLDRKTQLWKGGFYLGNNPDSPQIGDLRIRYDQVTPTTVSVISMAADRTFTPYRGKAGDTIDLLETGEHSAAEMFATAQEDNIIETWFLRALGTFMLLLGFQALNAPIAGLLRRLPLVGHALQKGFGCLAALVAALIALPLSAVIIALSWLYFHLT